jgi:4-amino-4-deoxy-L-arabinose transferase-like glycosyltransferase
MSRRQVIIERGILAAIVLAYVTMGVLYAVLTPRWQAPDEPAHYNYIRHLAETKQFPILQMGDYDQEYLREITNLKFDSRLSVDLIQYESHQPPLYYVLSTPFFILFGGALLPLRLLSVGFGTGLLFVAYATVKQIFPDRGWLALGTTAFIAFVPQHLAMTASVNNDTLAELILALVLFGLIRWLQSEEPASAGQLVGIGAIIGLALLTKVGVYITVPLALIAVWLKFFGPTGRGTPSSETRRTRARHAWVSAMLLLLPALILCAPWLIRNAVAYGNLDILGLKRHEQVVAGQPLSSDMLAAQGGLGFASTFATTTFRSFWAMFGWMAVPIDTRIYLALRLLTILVLLGLFMRLVDSWGAWKSVSPSVLLLGCSGLMTLATFLGYNLTFYQAQGRYLFPALIPLGLAWSVGLDESLHRGNARTIGIVLVLAAGLGAYRWLAQVCDSQWQMAVNGAGAAFMIARWLLPDELRPLFFAAPYPLLAALCAISPFWFIVPYLSP